MKTTISCRFQTTLFLFIILTTPSFAQFPQIFSNDYNLIKSGVTVAKAKITFHLNKERTRYSYSMSSKTTGIASWFRSDKINENSTGNYSQELGFLPTNYHYKRSGGKDENKIIKFNRDKKFATETEKNHSKKINTEADTIDRLVVQIALMHNFSNIKPEDNELEDIQYSVIDKGKLKKYNIKVIKKENLKTAIGKLDTIVVNRSRKGSS
ncbi:MAG: DUF3108 domain-containing protein, partial [Gammaproteobacteria bacterium]